MYVDEQMRPIETVPEMGGMRIKENDRGSDFKYDMFDIL
jgi:hypothetical protein